MTQPPKWRVWFADETIRGADGATQTRAWVSDFERSHTVPVIELAAVKELVAALKRIAGAESFVGYAFDGNYQFKSLFDEMVLRRKLAEDTLAKLPAEVLGED